MIPQKACAEYVVVPLQNLCDRTTEWLPKVWLLILNADVEGAFDHLSPLVVEAALEHARVHPNLIRAFLQESRDLLVEPVSQKLVPPDLIHMNRSVRQGGVDSAWLWNLVVYMVLDEVVPLWERFVLICILVA